MQILGNKVLLITTKKADQIVSLIPKSKIIERIGEHARVAVNWGVDEAKILRNLRIKNVPHPILGQYNWPGVYTPFEHQRATAAFLASHSRCFNLSEAGTGKSAAVAWAADYLMTKKLVSRVLIICPMSIMDTAWRADLFRTVMHRKVALASGSRQRRIDVINGDYEFVIINFDGVKIVRDELAAGGFDLIVVDEASFLKNVQTDRWKAVNSLIKPETRLWLLTGTPAAQSPTDAYGLAKLVDSSKVPRFFGAFRDRVMTKVTQFKWRPRLDAQEIVHSVLQPAIRYTKEQCLDLPDLLYSTRDVPMTAQQTKYYETLRKQMLAVAAGEEISAVNAASKLTKLLQVASGSAYTDSREVIEFDVRNRFEELLGIINSTDHKVIVFALFRHSLERLAQDLAKEGITSGALHGGVSAGDRAQTVKAFQTEDNPRVILAQPQAAAHGLTLTRADTIVWWSPVPSAELYIQGNARAHRAGQRNPVTVVRLQGSPVERRMYQLLDGKLDLHDGLLELYKQELT